MNGVEKFSDSGVQYCNHIKLQHSKKIRDIIFKYLEKIYNCFVCHKCHKLNKADKNNFNCFIKFSNTFKHSYIMLIISQIKKIDKCFRK